MDIDKLASKCARDIERTGESEQRSNDGEVDWFYDTEWVTPVISAALAQAHAAGAAEERARVVAAIEAERDLWATVDTPSGGLREEMCASLLEKVSP